ASVLATAGSVAHAGPEGAGRQLGRAADQLLAAELGEDVVHGGRVRPLLLAPMLDDAGAETALERLEGGVVLGPGQRPDALPLGVALEQLLRVAGRLGERRDQLRVLARERFEEHVAELRRHARRAELGDRLLDADQLAVA